MCDQLFHSNIIYDMNSISDYILSDCKCEYCLVINMKYKAMKIIVNFLVSCIKKYRKSKRNYQIKNMNLSENLLNNTCINLIFQDIFKINMISN